MHWHSLRSDVYASSGSTEPDPEEVRWFSSASPCSNRCCEEGAYPAGSIGGAKFRLEGAFVRLPPFSTTLKYFCFEMGVVWVYSEDQLWNSFGFTFRSFARVAPPSCSLYRR